MFIALLINLYAQCFNYLYVQGNHIQIETFVIKLYL